MSASLTKILEPALRYLAANEAVKVSVIAKKFNVTEKNLWAWLDQHNRGHKKLLARIIDHVLAEEAKPTAPKRVLVPRTAAKPAKVAKVKMADRRSRAPMPEVAPIARPLPGMLNQWLAEAAWIERTINTYQVRVTPELAARWLTLNEGNRTPSWQKIRRFAAAIRAGRWVLNGETVKFSETGRLLDGQSRLRAIVEAGVPAVLEVRGDLADATQQAMDIGEVRKGSHTLEMLGEKYPNILAPALRWVHRWTEGTLGDQGYSGRSVLENMQMEPLLVKHDGLRASVGWSVSSGHKIKNLLVVSEATFFHYLFGTASVEKRDAFFEALVDGIGLTKLSPAYHLRERLIAERATSAKHPPRERMALVIKAWNAHYAGEAMSMLRFRNAGAEREEFPTIAGCPAPGGVL